MAASHLILSLTDASRKAFRLKGIQDRHVPAPTNHDSRSNRGVTPTDDGVSGQDCDDCLDIWFSDPKKVSGRITFGSDPSRCDVLLVSRPGERLVSGQHFYITFVQDDDFMYVPVLCDVSRHGTIVNYNDRHMDDGCRHNFQWRLFWDYESFEVVVGRPNLELCIRFPRLDNKEQENAYARAVESFLKDAAPSDLEGLNLLTMRDAATSLAPSETLPTNQRPIYLDGEYIGAGTFGHVRVVRNVSTGEQFAAKQMYDLHRFDREWKNEINILRQLDHDNIVQFIDCCQVPQNLLIMEYLSLGSLSKQQSVRGFTRQELLSILCQCLTGLDYMHAQNIVHRDIKPQNILVQSRSPVHVKLADFGLARVDGPLKTFCGTEVYVAPEISQHSPSYTKAVDIWSVGVVFCEYMWGLPKPPRSREEEGLGPNYHDAIIAHLFKQDSDAVVKLVREHMLRKKADQRKSAEGCLSIALEISMSDKCPSPERSTTGRQSLSCQSTARLSLQTQSYVRPTRRSIAQAVTPDDNHRSTKRQRTVGVDKGKNDSIRRDLSQRENTGIDPNPAFYPIVLQDGANIEAVAVCDKDGYINATELLHIAGYDGYTRPFEWKDQKFHWDRRDHNKHPGIYTTPAACISICKRINLQRWEQCLRDRYGVASEEYLQDPKRVYDIIQHGRSSVAIRIADSRVNLTQILKLARLKRPDIKRYLNRETVKRVIQVVQGGNQQGSYVDFTTAKAACEDFGLSDWHEALELWENQHCIKRQDPESTKQTRTNDTNCQKISQVTANSGDDAPDDVIRIEVQPSELHSKDETSSDSDPDGDTIYEQRDSTASSTDHDPVSCSPSAPPSLDRSRRPTCMNDNEGGQLPSEITESESLLSSSRVVTYPSSLSVSNWI